MSTQPEQPKKRQSGVTGVAIPAGLLIGIGVGFLVDEIVAGTMIGLGCGFLLMLIVRAILGEW
jgi:F0F1-type ATP synthase assembly protein I